jgi:3D (Asp-Asp-Asp) domain-containing protein
VNIFIRTIPLLFLCGCVTRSVSFSVPSAPADAYVRLLATGYCPCGSCCSWERNWLGRPVFASGPAKGLPKTVGMTSSGIFARPGTLAADPAYFPPGTIMFIPGYGYGRVEDTGGAIKKGHIDLYFRSHQAALNWGSQNKDVLVWYP